MKLLVLFGFACVLCVQCNSTSQPISAFGSNFNPANSWEGLWNYGLIKDTNLNSARDGSVRFVEDLRGSDVTTGSFPTGGNNYQASSSPVSNNYVQNQANAVAYPYLHPAASMPQGYYSPGGAGWNSGKPSANNGLHGGLEQILEGIQLNKAVLGSLAGILGVSGIKGVIAVIKLGFLFLFVAVPLLLFITVPLSALLVIIILSIPIPTWPNKVRSLHRSLESASEILVQQIIDAECLERLVCSLDQLSKEYGKGSLINRIRGSIKTWKNFRSKNIIPGAESESSSCEQFQCSPTKILTSFTNAIK